jgi:hypothetical protein
MTLLLHLSVTAIDTSNFGNREAGLVTAGRRGSNTMS